MRHLDLCLRPVESGDENGRMRINVDFRRSYDEDLTLWYSIPNDQYPYVSCDLMDPFVTAALLKAMEDRATLRVHGPVSASLLDNLEEFQLIFSTWFPDKYHHPIDIVADVETEGTRRNHKVILSFSGGVDGAFSALNHVVRKGPIKRKLFDVDAILYIEGFDVNIQYDRECGNVVQRNRKLFASYPHLTFLNVRTNLKYLLSIKRFWMSHACVVASVASLFRTMWGGCLLGSSHSYLHLRPWGSHPLTDRLLSSRSFEMYHDTVFKRMEKLEALFAWPEALENLKVCWEGQYRYDTLPDTNCCRCDKCVRTMLAFKALGHEIPGSFAEELTVEKVQGLKNKPFDWSRLMFLNEILDTAKERGLEKMPVFAALAGIVEENSKMV
ncbi:MAG: hypothetical protein LJE96_02180 [Deltaproteobacteria bacterium]|nr:hypothetical protein [Deltaproteobacteria bacterium]